MHKYDILSEENFMKVLIGRTIIEIKQTYDEMTLKFKNGFEVMFYHLQDCCESVGIESVDGDLDDLLNAPLLMCEEVTNMNDDELPKREEDRYYDDSGTWTFYKFATVNGYVTVRWLGESNGYYSESVDISFGMEEDISDGYVGDNWVYVDGYISHYKKIKTIDDIKYYFGHEIVIAEKDNVYAHGKDSHNALVDLKFKLAGKNKHQYKRYNLDSTLPYDEAVLMYRIITGACRMGTDQFLRQHNIKVKPYTVKEIIALTQGRYGSKAFIRFFQK